MFRFTILLRKWWNQVSEIGEFLLDAANFTDRRGKLSLTKYDPATNTWTQKANFEGKKRYDAVGFSIDGKGLSVLARFILV